MKKFDSYIVIVTFLLVVFPHFAGAQTVTFSGNSAQVTTGPNNQFSPAIDGDIVVYSSTEASTGETDVYYTDLLSMTETAVTSNPGAQELQDISGGTIVFKDTTLSTGGSIIYTYDIASAALAPIASPNNSEDSPAISGNVIVFVSTGTNADIYAYDLVSGSSQVIANSTDDELNPRIDGSRIVYERFTAPGWAVVLHDLATNSQTTVATGLVVEPTPDISGSTIAYRTGVVQGDSDIAIYNLATAATNVIVAAGEQSRPRLNGDILAFDDAGTSDMDVVLRHLPSGVEARIPGTGSFEFLNDITAGRVSYSSNANGSFDIWFYEFTLHANNVTELESPAACGPDTVTIDFDEQQIGILDSNAYTHLGVTFLDDQWVTPLVLGTVQRGGSATSSEPNVLVNDADTLNPGSTGIPLTISFEPPVICTGMYVGNGGSAGLNTELRAYDQNGSLLGSVSDPVSDPATEFLGVASAVPIASITLDYGDTTLSEEIDDLSFVSAVDIDIAPVTVDFGDVSIGSSTTAIVTISNVGIADLTVDGISMVLAGSDLLISSAPSLPTIVPASGTVDVEITFAPSITGLYSAVLQISSNDPDESLVAVSLNGNGVLIETPPIQQIADILEFIDTSVANGTLSGNGPGNSAQGRLNALRNMLGAAADLIDQGAINDACAQLADVYLRTDGLPRPPDFLTGSAATAVAEQVIALMNSLGCT